MKNFELLFTTLVGLFIFIGCSSESNSENQSNCEINVYNENDVEICLLNVDEGRCPSDVICVWQGNAEVLLEINKSGMTQEFTLNTAGYINSSFNFPRKDTIFGVIIELTNLEPYPISTMEYVTEDYTLSLEVN